MSWSIRISLAIIAAFFAVLCFEGVGGFPVTYLKCVGVSILVFLLQDIAEWIVSKMFPLPPKKE